MHVFAFIGEVRSSAVRTLSPGLRAGRLSASLWGGVALVAIGLLAYMPGLLRIPPIDRDEPRFAQASRQMANGDSWSDWIVPHVQDRVRINKPPLAYWLQASAARAFEATGLADVIRRTASSGPQLTGDIWLYRAPSIFAAIVTMLATWRMGVRMFDARAAWLAGAIVGCAIVTMWDARLARADQIMVACTTLAIGALWSAWRQYLGNVRIQSLTLLFLWFATGLGILAKGPITPTIVGLTALALAAVSRDMRWLAAIRPLRGLLLLVLMILPWSIAVASEIGWEKYLRTMVDEVVGRGLTPKEGHAGPPGFHMLLLPVLFWPGSLLAGAAIYHGVRRGLALRERSAPERVNESARGGFIQQAWSVASRMAPGRSAEFFLLCWLVPSWIVFELAATKLAHYTMPLYPAIALLAGRAAFATKELAPFCRLRLVQWAVTGWLIGSVAIVVGVLALCIWFVAAELSTVALIMSAVGATLSAGLIFMTGRAWQRERFVRAQVLALGASLAASITLFQVLLPEARGLWLPSRAIALARDADPDGTRPLATVDYHEDSLIFLSSGRIQRITRWQLDAWMRANPNGLALIPNESIGAPRTIERFGECEGFNYSNGRWMSLSLIASRPKPVETQLPSVAGR